jgi:hypothetical protein
MAMPPFDIAARSSRHSLGETAKLEMLVIPRSDNNVAAPVARSME